MITKTANIEPCYAKETTHSRFALDLFKTNETVRINKEVFEQQLKGSNFPNDNLFYDLELLLPSCTYTDLSPTKPVMSNIKNVQASTTEILQMALIEYEKIFQKYETIIIPMSGGYDSRLNLAIAKWYQTKYKNRIIAFHKAGSDQELEIVKKVCEMTSTDCVIRRDNRKWSFSSLIYQPDFCLFHSGIYRHSIINYSAIMDEFTSIYPDCAFIGFGAECHKGKHYAKLDECGGLDWDKIFGYKIPKNVIGMAEKLFDDPYSQLDYIHYVVFIANGYGKRCFYYDVYYNVKFPLLNDPFLSAVFSLQRKEKEGAKLVTDWIKLMYPPLLSIPFISCCTKTFKLPSVFSRVKGRLIQKADKSLKNDQIIPLNLGNDSPILNRLQRIILEENSQYKLMYALQLYLFFGHAYISKGLNFEFREE